MHNFMETFKYLYVLTFENMSTNNFKTLRESVTDSKFLMGKNKVIGIALGVTEENTYKPNSYKVTEVNCHPMSGSKRTLRTVLYKQNQEVSWGDLRELRGSWIRNRRYLGHWDYGLGEGIRLFEAIRSFFGALPETTGPSYSTDQLSDRVAERLSAGRRRQASNCLKMQDLGTSDPYSRNCWAKRCRDLNSTSRGFTMARTTKDTDSLLNFIHNIS